MRRSRLPATVALAFMLAIGIAFFAAWAQDGGEGSCAAACGEAKERCLRACSAHSNPMECDERCEEEAQDCEGRCG